MELNKKLFEFVNLFLNDSLHDFEMLFLTLKGSTLRLFIGESGKCKIAVFLETRKRLSKEFGAIYKNICHTVESDAIGPCDAIAGAHFITLTTRSEVKQSLIY